MRTASGVGLIAVLVTLVVTAAAPAATKQRVGGFAVTWPASSGDTVPAGQALRVVVRRTEAAERRFARVRVIRLTDGAVVVARKVRRRAVVFTPDAAARYRVVVTVGRRSAHRTFATASPFCGASSPAPSASLTPSPSTARPGETVQLTLLNTGTDCLRTNALVALRRQDGTDVPLDRPTTTEIRLVQPATTYGQSFELPAGLPPGAYRVVKTVQSGPETSPVTLEVSAELTVTP